MEKGGMEPSPPSCASSRRVRGWPQVAQVRAAVDGIIGRATWPLATILSQRARVPACRMPAPSVMGR